MNMRTRLSTEPFETCEGLSADLASPPRGSPGRDATGEPGVILRLLVLRGEQRGRLLSFRPGVVLIGHGPECHVRSRSELVSRQHCLLHAGPRGALVRDLGSANGTLVNGRRLLGDRTLRDGDRIQLGPLVLQVVPVSGFAAARPAIH